MDSYALQQGQQSQRHAVFGDRFSRLAGIKTRWCLHVFPWCSMFSRYNWISLELDFVGFVALVEKYVEMESRVLMVEAIIYVVGSIYRRSTVPQFIQDAFFPAVGHFDFNL